MEYRLFDYNVKVFYDEDDGDYVAAIDEIKGCSAFAPTPELAIGELEKAYKAWLETVTENSYPIPVPSKFRKDKKSLDLQLPEQLRKKILELARKDNMNLNEEIIHFLKLGIASYMLSHSDGAHETNL